MQDLISLLLVVSFLGVSLAYVKLCARVRGKDEL